MLLSLYIYAADAQNAWMWYAVNEQRKCVKITHKLLPFDALKTWFIGSSNMKYAHAETTAARCVFTKNYLFKHWQLACN